MTDAPPELEAPVELLEELIAAAADTDVELVLTGGASTERFVDGVSVVVATLLVIGYIDDVASFVKLLRGGFSRWRRRREKERQPPIESVEIRVVRSDGTEEIHRVSGQPSDDDLERLAADLRR